MNCSVGNTITKRFTMLFQKSYRASLCIGTIAVLASCSSPMPTEAPPAAQTPSTQRPAPVQSTTQTASGSNVPAASTATNPRDYRRDGASHLYTKNAHRIYPGKMPPLLYAIGVLQVDIDARGAVTALRWMRAPTQAPEVVAEIEKSVRQAAPFPAPVKLGRVTYTDTWLWDKSGRFQLDTLTEGQL